MVKAVIIDDVQKARIALKVDLKDYCPEVTVVGEAEGVKDGIELVVQQEPDVVFLDIKMRDGTGFDFLERVNHTLNFQVIFTTAYDEYALKAFQFSAIDYLLKPVQPRELIRAISKVNAQQGTYTKDQIDHLLSNLSASSSMKRIALTSIDKIKVVELNTIIRCEAEKSYTTFFMKNGDTEVVSETLKHYDQLFESEGFLRTHHSHLVNLRYIKEFVKTDGGYLVMENGDQVPVSVRKKERVFEALKNC